MSDVDRRRDGDHWVLDKRVNITLIFAVVSQIAIAAWWFSDLNTRINAAEKEYAILSQKSEAVQSKVVEKQAEFDNRVIKLEIMLDEIRRSLGDIKDLLKNKR